MHERVQQVLSKLQRPEPLPHSALPIPTKQPGMCEWGRGAESKTKRGSQRGPTPCKRLRPLRWKKHHATDKRGPPRWKKYHATYKREHGLDLSQEPRAQVHGLQGRAAECIQLRFAALCKEKGARTDASPPVYIDGSQVFLFCLRCSLRCVADVCSRCALVCGCRWRNACFHPPPHDSCCRHESK